MTNDTDAFASRPYIMKSIDENVSIERLDLENHVASMLGCHASRDVS